MSDDKTHYEKDPKFETLGLEAEFLFKKLLRENGWGTVDATIHEDHKRKIDLWITKKWGQKICDEEAIAVQFTMDVYAAQGSKGMNAVRHGIIIVAISFGELKNWEKTVNKKEKSEKAEHLIEKVKGMIEGSMKIIQMLRCPLCKPENNLQRFHV
ncbi:MAG: hypothetical protein KAI72_03630 [Candidatus Pacebacteria bacterium]|nr:hypothetical protein [Candidatus Paceibacterota bacterium]